MIEELIKIVFYWSIGWSAYIFYLNPRKLGYSNDPLINILWFTFTLISGLLIFGGYSKLFGTDFLLLFVLSILILITVLLFWYSEKIDKFQKNYLIVKIFETGFQQFFIVSLVLWFVGYVQPNIFQGLVFGLVYGFLHLGILFVKGLGKWRYLYFISNFLGGVMFYYLISVGVLGVEISFLLYFVFCLYISSIMGSKILKDL